MLRVPILFGEVESVSESAVTSLWLKVRDTSESCALDHCQQRFPTHTRDVAVVCRKLCERARQVRVRDTNTVAVSRCCGGTYTLLWSVSQDPSINGIFHFSANEQMTKYEMGIAMAQAFRLSSNHLIPVMTSEYLSSHSE